MPHWMRKSIPHRQGHTKTVETLGDQIQPAASSRPDVPKSATALVVLALTCLVQFAAPTPTQAEPEPAPAVAKTKNTANPARDAKKKGMDLPKNVAEMRNALLAATQSARIEELLTPYEWNELPPAISDEKIDDPIAYWKRISRDKQGQEILLIIDRLLQLPPAKLHVGPDHENSVLYVWPYLAELDLSKLTPRQQFEFRTLVPPKEARKIYESKKWSWWRLAIGADGTWHSFMKHDQ